MLKSPAWLNAIPTNCSSTVVTRIEIMMQAGNSTAATPALTFIDNWQAIRECARKNLDEEYLTNLGARAGSVAAGEK